MDASSNSIAAQQAAADAHEALSAKLAAADARRELAAQAARAEAAADARRALAAQAARAEHRQRLVDTSGNPRPHQRLRMFGNSENSSLGSRSWHGSRSLPSSMSSLASLPLLLVAGGWPLCFSWNEIEESWAISRADDELNDEAGYLFKKDCSKVCNGECTGACTGGECDGGRENSALSLAWTLELFETGKAPCGILWYDTRDDFAADLKANDGWALFAPITSALVHEITEEQACGLLRVILRCGADVNALIDCGVDEDGARHPCTPLGWAVILDLPVVSSFLRKNGGTNGGCCGCAATTPARGATSAPMGKAIWERE